MTRRAAKWGFVFAVWAVITLTAAGQSYIWRVNRNMPAVWSEILIVQSLDYVFWALMTPLILVMSWRFPFRGGKLWRSVAAHLGFIGVVMVVHAAYRVPLYWYAYEKFAGVPGRKMFRDNLVGFYDGLWMYVTVVLAAHVFAYYQELKERDARAVSMQNQLSKAQLQALKIQLQPHFLFNTLHAITSLVHEDPERAETLLVRLSDLLRMSLENPMQEVPVRQELEFLNLYLEIQQARFGDRLVIEQKIAAGTMDAMVPSMVLQPLVENAVRHAIEPRSSGGAITIAAEMRRERLLISVQDDGPGISTGKGSEGNGNGNGKRREGIGIANTRARLQHLYGDDHRFEMRNRAGSGCEVLLDIPFRLAPEQEDEELAEATP